jgi:hypothetical protein
MNVRRSSSFGGYTPSPVDKFEKAKSATIVGPGTASKTTPGVQGSLRGSAFSPYDFTKSPAPLIVMVDGLEQSMMLDATIATVDDAIATLNGLLMGAVASKSPGGPVLVAADTGLYLESCLDGDRSFYPSASFDKVECQLPADWLPDSNDALPLYSTLGTAKEACAAEPLCAGVTYTDVSQSYVSLPNSNSVDNPDPVCCDNDGSRAGECGWCYVLAGCGPGGCGELVPTAYRSDGTGIPPSVAGSTASWLWGQGLDVITITSASWGPDSSVSVGPASGAKAKGLFAGRSQLDASTPGHLFHVTLPFGTVYELLTAGGATLIKLTRPDTDGDGYPDTDDTFPEDPDEWVDTDGDLIGDHADEDDDGDSTMDIDDDFPLDPTETTDTDGDNVPDDEDPDDDGDGTVDVDDALPLDPTETIDTDEDTVGDNADPDDDGDGRADPECDAALPEFVRTHKNKVWAAACWGLGCNRPGAAPRTGSTGSMLPDGATGGPGPPGAFKWP